MNKDKKTLVSVFSTNNNNLFQIAKSILKKNRIKFYSNGDFLNTLNAAAYSAEIKVFEKDEAAAKELLDELAPSSYQPTSKFEKYLVKNGIIIIIVLFLIIFIILVMAKK